MPRSRSTFIQSEVARRRSPRAFTAPARLMAPPNSSSFSVSVVLPASGCAMIAKVRRRATSSDSGERDGDSVATAVSDMAGQRLAGKTGAIKGVFSACGTSAPSPYGDGKDDLHLTIASAGTALPYQEGS